MRKVRTKSTVFLGKAFADSLFKSFGSKKAPNLDDSNSVDLFFGKSSIKQELKLPEWRFFLFYFLSLAVFLILFTRLFNLQILEGSNFYYISEENRIRLKVVRAPRGVIYDRNGKILAQNMPGFRVVLDPEKIQGNQMIIESLAGLLKIPQEEILFKMQKSSGPFTVKNEVDREAIFSIESNEKFFKGVSVEISPVRQYLYPEELSHLLGYTGEVTVEKLKQDSFYKAGDLVGKDGIEASYEDDLKGVNGYDLLKVSSSGKKDGDILSIKPNPGKNIYLTVDLDLQLKMKQFLQEKIQETKSPGGAVVAMNPKTGEILGMVSLPTFDNNLFSKGIASADYNKLLSNPLNPLLNRSVSGAYPPGSTFKLITSAAALEDGKINKDTKIEDTGFVQLGSIKFNNWLFTQQGRTEGEVDVIKALARSNDVFFYRVGQMVGEKSLQDWAKRFGLGETLGIKLNGEVSGLVPTEEWKLKTREEPWYPGETLNLSIGQGDLLVTPLQIASWTSTIANGGRIMKPILTRDQSPQIVKENFLKPETIDLIKTGMKKALENGGTAWPFFDFKVPTAGKTGTAESGKEKPHALFTAFAPYDEPEIVVTVILENSGEGSNVASPVAKKILEYYFSR